MDVVLSTPARPRQEHNAVARPRLGFVGLGWIGRHRMQAVVEAGLAEIVAIADSHDEALQAAQTMVPAAEPAASMTMLLDQDLDGVVIATPSALHAQQAQAALSKKLAVFCQKPLARTGAETIALVEAARAADRRLGVDFSYRLVRGVDQMRRLILQGELGEVFAAELTFHNAYGPDKAWFRDPRLSGGGCLIDLGTHLIDLAQWMFEFPPVESVSGQLYSQGHRLRDPDHEIEDYALAQWTTACGATVRLACSWNLSAGQDAVIGAAFHGTRGSVSLRNVNGSFYDFVIEHAVGTERRTLAEPPDAWGGRAIVEWTRRIAADQSFDPEAAHFTDVARVVDQIYGR